MANKTIIFKNNRTNQVREAGVGLSWTALLFGPFVAICRKSVKWSLMMSIAAFFTCCLSNIFFFVIFNKLYIRELMREGYVPIKAIRSGCLEDYCVTNYDMSTIAMHDTCNDGGVK